MRKIIKGQAGKRQAKSRRCVEVVKTFYFDEFSHPKRSLKLLLSAKCVERKMKVCSDIFLRCA